MPWWQKLLPYFLYFIIAVSGTFFLYKTNSRYVGSITFGFVHLFALFIWIAFMVSSISYFAINRYIHKKSFLINAFFICLLPLVIAIIWSQLD